METFGARFGGAVGGPVRGLTEVAPPRNGGAPSNGSKKAEPKSKRLNLKRLNPRRLNPKMLIPRRLNPMEDCNQYT